MFILLFRAVISIVNGIIVSNKMKKAQMDSVNINQTIEQQRRKLETELLNQMVKDDYCGKMIDKRKAFIVRLDDRPYHFCSWECRQKFIQETS